MWCLFSWLSKEDELNMFYCQTIVLPLLLSRAHHQADFKLTTGSWCRGKGSISFWQRSIIQLYAFAFVTKDILWGLLGLWLSFQSVWLTWISSVCTALIQPKTSLFLLTFQHYHCTCGSIFSEKSRQFGSCLWQCVEMRPTWIWCPQSIFMWWRTLRIVQWSPGCCK